MCVELAVALSGFPNLEGLDDLARRKGVDTRPTLVRVLTDLYIQKPAHSPDEERHYTELVLRLLDAVDAPTRAIIAQKLAAYAAAPRVVVLRLARDAIEIAEPILREPGLLSAPELQAVAEECGSAHAAAIAAREPSQPASAPGPLQRLPAPRRAAASLLPRSSTWRRVVPSLAPASAGVSDLGELFFTESSPKRRAMLAELGEAEDTLAPQPQSPGAVERLEAAALTHNCEEFIHEVERALGIGAETARRMVEDASGEPLLVIAKALAMPSEVLLRILLFINPAIGQSVPRVFDLAKYYPEITQNAAVRLVASLRGEAAPRPAHQPALWNDDGESGRRAGTEAARRGLAPSMPSARRESASPGRRHGTT
jgi:hypothetical protein